MGRIVRDVKQVKLPPCGFFVDQEKGSLPIKVEKRSKGKKVTVLSGIRGDSRSALITLQSMIGVGGSVVSSNQIELQGSLETQVIKELQRLGACARLDSDDSARPTPIVLAATGYSSYLRKTQELINKRQNEQIPMLPTSFTLPETCLKLHGSFWPYCVGRCTDVDLSDVFDSVSLFQRNNPKSSESEATLKTASLPKDERAVAMAIEALSARIGTAVREVTIAEVLPVVTAAVKRPQQPQKPQHMPTRRQTRHKRIRMPRRQTRSGIDDGSDSAYDSDHRLCRMDRQMSVEPEMVDLLTMEEWETLKIFDLDRADEFWSRLFARVESGADLHAAFTDALSDALDVVLVESDSGCVSSPSGEECSGDEYQVPYALWGKLKPEQHKRLEECGLAESREFWETFKVISCTGESHNPFEDALRLILPESISPTFTCPVCQHSAFESEEALDRHIDDCLTSSYLTSSNPR